MRRILGLLLVVVLLAPALAAVADDDGDYADDFSEGNYAGNDGSIDFPNPWVEIGDSGQAGPGGGLVHIVDDDCSNNDCARIDGSLLPLIPYGLSRAADLSIFDEAELSYRVTVEPAPIIGLLNTSKLRVQVFDGTWVTVREYALNQSRSDQAVTVDVSDHANAGFQVRFVVTNGLTFNGFLTIDRVVISGDLTPAPPTTTTSTTTSTTSTTSTTAPTTTTTTMPIVTTTTTSGSPTTSSGSSPTTTAGGAATTSTTAPGAGTEPGGGTGPGATTTTTTTTTTPDASGGPIAEGPTDGGPTDGDPTEVSGEATPPDPGLRVPAVGLIAGYSPGMMGDMDMEGVEVLGLTLDADFSLAVEAFEAARVWIAALALLIAAAVVSGMDRRRTVRQAR